MALDLEGDRLAVAEVDDARVLARAPGGRAATRSGSASGGAPSACSRSAPTRGARRRRARSGSARARAARWIRSNSPSVRPRARWSGCSATRVRESSLASALDEPALSIRAHAAAGPAAGLPPRSMLTRKFTRVCDGFCAESVTRKRIDSLRGCAGTSPSCSCSRRSGAPRSCSSRSPSTSSRRRRRWRSGSSSRRSRCWRSSSSSAASAPRPSRCARSSSPAMVSECSAPRCRSRSSPGARRGSTPASRRSGTPRCRSSSHCSRCASAEASARRAARLFGVVLGLIGVAVLAGVDPEGRLGGLRRHARRRRGLDLVRDRHALHADPARHGAQRRARRFLGDVGDGVAAAARRRSRHRRTGRAGR